MDAERLISVRQAMHEAKIDALVCRLPENVLFLSGHWPLCGWTFLVFPREGRPTCILPHCDEQEACDELWEAERVPFLFGILAAGDPYADVARAMRQAAAGRKWRTVGFEAGFESVAPPWNAAEPAIPAAATRVLLESVFGVDRLIDATDLLNAQRARKTPREIARLRVANEVAAFGLKAFQKAVAPGATGIELVAGVEQAVAVQGTGYKGVRRVRAFAQVATGARETSIGYRPMEISTTRRLVPGDLALLELGVVVDGFWSDRTRVRVAGAPSDAQRRVFDTVKRAQEAAVAAVRPGVKAGQVDEAARSIVRAAGYDREFPHVTGHGIGFRYHEGVPLIAPGSDLALQPGMLHTVEPGIYAPEIGGIRLEDNIVVTADGHETLGPFAMEMFS